MSLFTGHHQNACINLYMKSSINICREIVCRDGLDMVYNCS